MSYRPKCVIRAPVATRSGYGEMSRDIVRHIIEYDKYDVEVHSINWGNTPMTALDDNDPMDTIILERIKPEEFQTQPDIYISISIPTEFRPIGKFNIGVTAGIETTAASHKWIQALNQMNVNFVISKHSKDVFMGSQYDARDEHGNSVGQLKCESPIEILHNCIDTYIYKKMNEYELETSIKEELKPISEKFNYLFVGHWLKGDVGQDRKNVGLLIKIFYELFKRTEFEEKPGLILKTSNATYSLIDREEILKKIRSIRDSVVLEKGESLPNVYLLHGDLTEKEMSSLYNHPKVKANISLTKGEGFGRPLLEASLTGKPVMAPGWSGHMDFLNTDESILIGGTLEEVDKSSIWEDVIIEGAQWFSPDHNMVAQGMVELFKNYAPWKKKANQLAKTNKTNFNYKKIRKDLWNFLDNYVPEFEEPAKPMALSLPKLKKVGEERSLSLPQLRKVGEPEENPKVELELPKLKRL